MNAGMKLEHFAALLDAYGAEPSRWPEREREAVLALLAASAEARALRDQAAQLDTALVLSAPTPTLALRAAVLRAIPSAPAAGETFADTLRALWRGIGGWRLAAPAFATSLALGIALGASVLPPTPAAVDDDADLMQLALLDDGDTEFAP